MPYRNVVIHNEAKLSLKNRQLSIETEAHHATLPIEDIDVVLIENRKSLISCTLLSELAKNKVAVFICDEKHAPCAVLQPFAQHSRYLEVSKNQLALSLPAKKQLWKSIVVAKIKNQARALSLVQKEDCAKMLFDVAKRVTSGDGGNAESHAAALYFPRLFGTGFTRGNEDNHRNAWLNYGYAILRGCIARHIVAYGFLPMFGLQHHSELNQYNLADDFIEPYRPIVDLYVAKYTSSDSELTSAAKGLLVNIINHDIIVNEQKHSVSRAIELTIQSFSALVSGRSKTLLLPELTELNLHTYE